MLRSTSTQRTYHELMWMGLIAIGALVVVALLSRTIQGRLPMPDRLPTISGAAMIVSPTDPPSETPPAKILKSPLAGIFRAGEFPGDPPYVTVGMTVEQETLVGHIEPMDANTMPILAGVAGRITEITAQDSHMVTAGEELMKIQPTPKPESPYLR